MLPRIPWRFLGILNVVGAFAIGRPAQQCTGRSLVKVGGTYVARAIRQYRTKPLKLGEGVETGWRASLVDEGTVRLSSKGESDRITQRSAVRIRPPQPMNATAEMQWRSPFTEPSDRCSHLYVEPRRYSGYVTGTTNADSHPGRPMRCTRF